MIDEERIAAVALAEYTALRQEILQRSQVSNALVGLSITIVGAALTLRPAEPQIVSAAAVVGCLLWMFWIDHSTAIFKIAAFLTLHTSDRERGSSGRMTWEVFIRNINHGGEEANAALNLDTGSDVRMPKRSGEFGLAVPVALAVAPIGLLGTEVTQFASGGLPLARIVTMTIGIALWLSAAAMFWAHRRVVKVIGLAILRTTAGTDGLSEA